MYIPYTRKHRLIYTLGYKQHIKQLLESTVNKTKSTQQNAEEEKKQQTTTEKKGRHFLMRET